VTKQSLRLLRFLPVRQVARNDAFSRLVSEVDLFMINKKAVALLSGGLDSTLAVCILKEQGVEIEAVYFQTMFGCCKEDARQVARRLGVPFTLLKVADDYLKVIEKPKYGYGRGINPCVDCRIYMFRAAKKFMQTVNASFLISGEVLDQRPMSQKMNDLRNIEKNCGLEGLILRPLSAKLLPLTEPEKQGVVEREKLFGIHGRSRAKLLELAEKYGIENPPTPSTGCALTSPVFAKKVRDVFVNSPDYKRWEFELLKIGRHFRLSPEAKVIVARNRDQNEYLEIIQPAGTMLLRCKNFGGPHALVIGSGKEEVLRKTAGLMLRYAHKSVPPICEIEYRGREEWNVFTVTSKNEEPQPEELRIA
jgi:tRNA-uridine 2-sulfurtransferase